MKKRFAIILTCLLLACTSAGCAGQNNNESSSAQSAASGTAETSVQIQESGAASGTEKTPEESKGAESIASGTENSKTENSADNSVSEAVPDPESDIVIDIDGDGKNDPGVSIDEEGNIIIDPEQFSGWEEDPDDSELSYEYEEVDDPLAEMQYMILALSPDGFGTGFDKPEVYNITSADELAKFINDNDTKYSLSKKYSGTEGDFAEMSFKEATADATAELFAAEDMVVIVTPYSKSGEVDLGDLSADDKGGINVVVWAQQPKDAADKGYACLIVEVSKGALKGKTVSAAIDPNAYLEDAPEENAELLEEE